MPRQEISHSESHTEDESQASSRAILGSPLALFASLLQLYQNPSSRVNTHSELNL